MQFQVAASNSLAGPFNFVGPDGTAATFFTTSGASLSQFNGNRYLRYKALLATSDSASTPTLSDVTICYSHAALAAPFTISGQITSSSGGSMGGVTVALSGSQTGTTATDDSGNYSLSVPSGGSVTITPTLAGYTFAPTSLSFNNVAANRTANFVGTPSSPVSVAAGTIIISEFRLRGAQGAADEFIELYNNSDQDVTVGTNDGSPGWALSALDAGGTTASTVFTLVNGTTIPARGHYLIVNNTPTTGYSLGSAASGDGTFADDIADDTGLALFTTSNPLNVGAPARLDAVGFQYAGGLADIYREGTGLPNIGANDGQYTFVRKLLSGRPQNTGDNAADFLFVSTDAGSYGGVQSALGAPGPENSASPFNRGSQIKLSLFDVAAPATGFPNRERSLTSVTNGSSGTLVLRRTFTNNTGATVTRLRFRVVDVTTAPQAANNGTADLRLLETLAGSVATSGGSKSWVDMPVEPPTQANGGGYNSTVVATLPGGGLTPGDSINIEFTLGVQQAGSFRFFVIVEALPGPPSGSAASPVTAPVTGFDGAKGSTRPKSLPGSAKGTPGKGGR